MAASADASAACPTFTAAKIPHNLCTPCTICKFQRRFHKDPRIICATFTSKFPASDKTECETCGHPREQHADWVRPAVRDVPAVEIAAVADMEAADPGEDLSVLLKMVVP